MNSKNKGFTLIELLAVIVLLAIVGIVGANLIITRLNKAKVDTMINDFMDLQKEIAYKSMNDDICGGQSFTTRAELRDGIEGKGWYTVYRCTKYYDVSADDYKVFLGYATRVYNSDGTLYTDEDKKNKKDKFSYYINKKTQERVLLHYVSNNPYKYVDTTGNSYTKENLSNNYLKELDNGLLYVQLAARKSGKFKNVSFTNEDRKKICEGYTKGSCGTSSISDRNAFIVAKKEL